jgi:predicted nucleic acid-binding protein
MRIDMKITIDTSVIISVITNEKHRSTLIKLTKGKSLIAPDSLHLEIGNAFSAVLKRNRISIENALLAIQSYEKIPIQFCSIDLEKAIKISSKLNIYAYDAYFLECAERNRSPLLSIDEGMIDAAIKYGIQIIEV